MEETEKDKRRKYDEYLKQFAGLAYKPMSYEEWKMQGHNH